MRAAPDARRSRSSRPDAADGADGGPADGDDAERARHLGLPVRPAARPRARATPRRWRSTPPTTPWSTTSRSPWSGSTATSRSPTPTRPTPLASCDELRRRRRHLPGRPGRRRRGHRRAGEPGHRGQLRLRRSCLTYALASQLVVTLDGPLSDAAMAALRSSGPRSRTTPGASPAAASPELQGALEGLPGPDPRGHRQRPVAGARRRPGTPTEHRVSRPARRTRARHRREVPGASPRRSRASPRASRAQRGARGAGAQRAAGPVDAARRAEPSTSEDAAGDHVAVTLRLTSGPGGHGGRLLVSDAHRRGSPP